MTEGKKETAEEERRRLCRENYAAQLESCGYKADGNPMLINAAEYAPENLKIPVFETPESKKSGLSRMSQDILTMAQINEDLIGIERKLRNYMKYGR